MTVDQEVCLGQAEGLLPKTVATWKSEECMCLVRCHVSGKKKNPHHASFHAMDASMRLVTGLYYPTHGCSVWENSI